MSKDSVLIIGGGVAGLEAALHLAACKIAVVLAEKEPSLGGRVAGFSNLFPTGSAGTELTRRLIVKAAASPLLTLLKDTEVTALTRDDNAFKAVLQRKTGGQETLACGAVLFAAGCESFPAACYGEYGYGRYDAVITGLEFEQQLAKWTAKKPRAAAFVQCVGARDRSKGMPYCSRICCMYTAKQAAMLRKALPDCQIYVFYMDIRTNFPGGEECVRRVMEEDRVHYIRGRVSKVFPHKERLLLRAEDTLMGLPVELEADLVVLAAALLPASSAVRLAAGLGAVTDAYGFLRAPLSAGAPTRIAGGVFSAGGCTFPVSAAEAMTQGAAAAADVCAYLQQTQGRVAL